MYNLFWYIYIIIFICWYRFVYLVVLLVGKDIVGRLEFNVFIILYLLVCVFLVVFKIKLNINNLLIFFFLVRIMLFGWIIGFWVILFNCVSFFELSILLYYLLLVVK